MTSIGCVSLLYATVGQAGGTAFLAVMTFADIPANEMRPTVLTLNIIAAGYATLRLSHAGIIDRMLLLQVTAPSLVTAFLGGLLVLGGSVYCMLTFILLAAAAGLMVFSVPPIQPKLAQFAIFLRLSLGRESDSYRG
jgi:uncharacterized membrane protein YfcA